MLAYFGLLLKLVCHPCLFRSILCCIWAHSQTQHILWCLRHPQSLSLWFCQLQLSCCHCHCLQQVHMWFELKRKNEAWFNWFWLQFWRTWWRIEGMWIWLECCHGCEWWGRQISQRIDHFLQSKSLYFLLKVTGWPMWRWQSPKLGRYTFGWWHSPRVSSNSLISWVSNWSKISLRLKVLSS